MNKLRCISIVMVSVMLVGCFSPDADKIANEFCHCRDIEAQNGPVQGEQCFNDWDRKYGKVRLSDAEMTIFKTITINCNAVHGK